MSDGEILQNLSSAYGWKPKDMGAGGNCLFLSMAPQVTSQDVGEAIDRSPAWAEALGSDLRERWGALSIMERAGLLRRIAIMEEREFVAKLARSRKGALPEETRRRVAELFKDMAEEFASRGETELAAGVSAWGMFGRSPIHAYVRKVAEEWPADKTLRYVLEHAEEYMQITGTEGNWAGSSEMSALARALRRPFASYGNDKVSSDFVELEAAGDDGAWVVKPYFFAAPPRPSEAEPVRIFQTNGGGHYQMLA